MTPDEKRFWSKVDRLAGPDGCWLWTAGGSGGYGRFTTCSAGIKTWHAAYRYAYEVTVGPVPDGLELDHRCRTPACVNPRHLEPVSHRENIVRGTSPAAAHAAKTHCINGHEFTPENTYTRGGMRGCRACHRNRERQRKARLAE